MKTWLIENGWRTEKTEILGNQGWFAWRPYPNFVDCVSNEKPPIAVLAPHRFQNYPLTFELDITGMDSKEVWFKLRAYGLSEDDVKMRVEEIVDQLRKAWNAVNA